jgi:transcriptional regulator with XRE-family HTH domain
MGVATIGTALAERRSELKIEKGQAAEKIGMSRTTYSSYEQDAQRPSVDVFPALAEFLNISIEDLFSLYGATCVAAARASYEHNVSKTPVRRDVSPAPSVSSLTIETPEDTRPVDDPDGTMTQGAADGADTEQSSVSEVRLELSENPVEQPDPNEAEENVRTTLGSVAPESSPSAEVTEFSSDEYHSGYKKKKKKKKK